MTPETIFRIHLVAGYAAWLPFFAAYAWPWLKSMERDRALRLIATLHGFRFFGLVFLLPGVVGALPARFTAFAAYGDFATGVLALVALSAFRIRPLFLASVVAFNLAGLVDLLVDYTRAVQVDLPSIAGALGSAYAIPILYVPLLMITHIAAFVLLARPATRHAMA